MPHEHLAVSAFVVVHGALNSVFVSLLLILIELSMYSRIANVAELSPFRLQQSGSWTKRVLCTITDKQWRMRTQREPRFLFTPMTIINIDIIDGIMFANVNRHCWNTNFSNLLWDISEFFCFPRISCGNLGMYPMFGDEFLWSPTFFCLNLSNDGPDPRCAKGMHPGQVMCQEDSENHSDAIIDVFLACWVVLGCML